MFYLASVEYVGPNQDDDRYVDSTEIQVLKSPVKINGMGADILDGWAGEYNGWSTSADGVAATLEEAEAKIFALWGDVREIDHDGRDPSVNIAAVYKPGKYAPLSRSSVIEIVWEDFNDRITAESTDEDLEYAAFNAESVANDHEWTCNGLALTIAGEIRAAKLKEVEVEAA
ncbi:Rossmann-fold NAD(P)-binding domain-containing protein [Pararhizobium qamdonense]|uniref:hypothetical protein n=1 Tax=Pararhizobium qamdonense TaxID=3031126 RepID=UPI0023E24E34|nr:hypothetical protein [Pararhizobium qamdonense]